MNACVVCGEQGCRCRACDRIRLNRGGHGPMWTPPAHTCVLAALTGGSTPNPADATGSNAPTPESAS